MKKYPLEQLVFIKKKKLEEAERILREKKAKLLEQQQKLQKLQQERDEVKAHREEKIAQLRAGLDEGIKSTDIETMQIYLKLVNEKLAQHEKKVQEQQKQVIKAEDEVKIARQEMLRREKEIEKLHVHQKTWKKEQLVEEEREEAKESDEIGSTRFYLKKKERKPRG